MREFSLSALLKETWAEPINTSGPTILITADASHFDPGPVVITDKDFTVLPDDPSLTGFLEDWLSFTDKDFEQEQSEAA